MTGIKSNRPLSFAIVGIIYALASFVGIMLFRALSLDLWLSLLICDAAATVFTYCFSIIFENSSVYDPYWSVQPIVIAYALCFSTKFYPADILFLVAISFWGIRLTANWAYTFKNLNAQDWRYTMLREKTGKFYSFINFVGIHLVPTLVVYAATLPVAYVAVGAPEVNPIAVVFICFAVFAATIQGIADFQLHRFKKRGGKGFIRAGLWKYSRHPNYLGEILMWWCIALAATFTLGFKWYYLIGAVSNTLLFLFVSIPMADGRQSRKPGFEDYKKETRMLLPIPKRSKKG
jgi:steroid 5-alpha reductase family enzyme